MEIKTSDLVGAALDWAVAKADGKTIFAVEGLDGPKLKDSDWNVFSPSTDWGKGGPIIEREGIDFQHDRGCWLAAYGIGGVQTGPTPLIAAMRCLVASRLGDTVNIPEELTK